VHLPSYPFNEWNQVNEWVSPTGARVEVELQLARRSLGGQAWVLTSRAIDVALDVRGDGEAAQTLRRGDRVRIAGGALRFDGVRLWMGYEIVYEPLLPWLFAAALVAVCGLAWHFQGKFRSRPLAERESLAGGRELDPAART
jgi:cytochrome c biogenesis protein